MENEQRSVRMSYIFPMAIAIVFMFFDIWGVYKGAGAHAAQYIFSPENFVYEIFNCFFDIFIGYIPASAFSLICFAFAQQKIYNTSAGLVDTYDHILVTYSITIIYGCMYIVFLTSGNQFIDKIIIFTATIAFCLFIWFFAISKDVKKIDSSQEKSINRITGKQ